MTRKLTNLAGRYQAALRAHLRHKRRLHLDSARRLGSRARIAGIPTLELARLHEQTLVTNVLPGCAAKKRAALIARASRFFSAAVNPLEPRDFTKRAATRRLEHFIEALCRRTAQLAASNMDLRLEIAHRKAAVEALHKSERHYSRLLRQSDRLQEQLRLLSRRILSAQEDERRKISRELHDVIGQTLTGINVRLAALKKDALINTKGLNRNIARTQRLVERSVEIVHRFARELRPAVLDDLGLIPALHSFVKTFSKQTHIRVHLKAYAAVEHLDGAKRTALYRVAQEALTNVARHARASRVELRIEKLTHGVRMTVKDDGRAFRVQHVLATKRNKRLGLLGMRERVEMVGGRFTVESKVGHGTTIRAEIPLPHPKGISSPTLRRMPGPGKKPS